MTYPNRTLVVVGALLLGALIATIWWVPFGGWYQSGFSLPGYATVITDHDPEEAAAMLSNAGYSDIVTPRTTEVFLSRFDHVAKVPLSVALSLDPEDPRVDPYVAGLQGYFTADDDWRLYVRHEGSTWRLQRDVRAVLGTSSTVGEWTPLRIAMALAVFLVMTVASLAVEWRRWEPVACAALPWIPVVLGFGMTAAVIAGASLFLVRWALAGIEYRLQTSTDGLLRAVVAPDWPTLWLGLALMLGLTHAGLLVGWKGVAAVAIAFLGSAAGGLGILIGRVGKRRDPDHLPFVPISILPSAPGFRIDRMWLRVGISLALFALLIPPAVDRLIPGGVIPRLNPTSTELDYPGVLDLSSRQPANGLPDLSDYLAHRAYQVGLVFGREYGVPTPEEQLVLSRFSEDANGVYTRFPEVVYEYDPEWFDSVMTEPVAGVSAILIGLGRPAGVVLDSTESLYSGYPQLLQHLVFVLLALAPFTVSALPWATARGNRRVVAEVARRRRQVA